MTLRSSASPFRSDSLLFGTSKSPKDPKAIQASPLRHGSTGLGYLAFPGGMSPSLVEEVGKQRLLDVEKHKEKEEIEASRKKREAEEAEAWKVEEEKMKALREARLAREAEEARKGEEYWVSCGGVLRDKNGNRDLERTNQIREELKLRQAEKRLQERWDTYESRWKDLNSQAKLRNPLAEPSGTEDQDQDDNRLLTFADIPWPVDKPEGETVTFDDLHLKNIEAFLFGPLTIRGSTVTKKERVRSSLLRWHPDKLTSIVDMVNPEAKQGVMEGIHAVVRRLQKLNADL
jgi:hypothetical protein